METITQLRIQQLRLNVQELCTQFHGYKVAFLLYKSKRVEGTIIGYTTCNKSSYILLKLEEPVAADFTGKQILESVAKGSSILFEDVNDGDHIIQIRIQSVI